MRTRTVTTLACLALAASACGGDDEIDPAALADFCAAMTEVDQAFLMEDMDGVTAAIQRAHDAAPADVAEDIAPLLAALDEQGPAAFEDEAPDGVPATAELAADTYMLDNCDGETLEVVAVDYGYTNAPIDLAAGTYLVDFSNDSANDELHEAVFLRKNDGVTESAEEIAEMDFEEVFEFVTPRGIVFSQGPGDGDVARIEMDAGDWIMICFLPLDSSGPEDAQGPPHFTQGMVREFTVT